MNKEKILKQILNKLDNMEKRVRYLESEKKGVKPSGIIKKQDKEKKKNITTTDFKINIRAFIKRYAKGLSNPRKFTLLLAYLVKGKTSKEKSSKDIEKNWNRMKSLLGGEFKQYSAQRAKEYDWVDSRKTGLYCLTSNWMEIFIIQKKKK